MSYKVEVPAKCILAGEHTVLRGGTALVTPLQRYKLTLKYYDDSSCIYPIAGCDVNSLYVLLLPVLEKVYQLLEKDFSHLRGYFVFENEVPIACGLGFSASLCSALAYWASDHLDLPKSEIYLFARELENSFHGKSSGVDIAGVMAKGLVHFIPNTSVESVEIKWKPMFYLSTTNEQSITSRCIEIVNGLVETNPELSVKIDEQMKQATTLILRGLTEDKQVGERMVGLGMQLGNDCFEKWNLISPKLRSHMSILSKYTDYYKVVGAGFGGYVLSYWDSEPPDDIDIELIPLEI